MPEATAIPRAEAAFDRILGTLHDLPDVRATRPSTVATVLPILGNAQTFVVRTYRRGSEGFTIFLETVDAEGRARLVIPAKVADAIYRQHDALTDRSTPASRARDRAKREREKKRKERADRKAAWRASHPGGFGS